MSPGADLDQFRSALLMLAQIQLKRQRVADLEASDLVQQTFLEAHRDRARFRGQTSEELFAWLRQILQNNLLDAWEKLHAGRRDIGRKRLEADLTESFAGLDELLIGAQSSPSERAMQNEQMARLAAALEQLPAQQREAILLKHFAGWTLQEISDGLQCSLSSTAGLLFRGRRALKALLED